MAMWELIDQEKLFWFQEEDRWPRIGEVRGKALLFSRFGREKKSGLSRACHPCFLTRE